MPYANPDALVTTQWLEEHLESPLTRVVDASWYLPNQKRDPRAEFEAEHIPGAVFFDIDEVADTSSPLAHMLPSEEKFSELVGKLGIGNEHRVVFYDGHGCMSAARAWWTFRVFGHRKISVLDGGLPKWKREGRPLISGPAEPSTTTYRARFHPKMVRGLEEMLALVQSKEEQILDARSEGRWRGKEPEPREGLRGGRIPGSLNLPFPRLMDPDTKTFKSAEELRSLFQQAGIELGRPVVTTCGSGASACVLTFGLHLIGYDNTAVYDGSWAEWGSRDDTPIERDE